MDHTKIVKDLIEQLPLPKYILETFPCSWVYGGFMRWVVTFIEENKRSPTVEEVREKLSRSDMDIRIRSNYEHREWCCSQIIRQIFIKVRELNGKVEFMGHQYRDLPVSDKHEAMLLEDGKGFSCYYGNYSVWLPIGEEKWNRYDISIFNDSGIYYMTDFKVNDIQYNLKNGLTYDRYYDLSEVLPYIRDKNMDFAYVDAKKIYRGAKLWKQGYTISSENVKKLRETYLELERDWETFYIFEGDLTKPSVMDAPDNLISITQHTSTKVTREIFYKNPFVRYIFRM